MSDWQAKLNRLGKDLQQREQAELNRQAAATAEFQRALAELAPVGEEVAQVADAYGVACQWTVSRAGAQPGFRFRTIAAGREYAVECRQGQVFVRVEGQEAPVRLQDLTAAAVKDALMELVVEAANTQRPAPPKRRGS